MQRLDWPPPVAANRSCWVCQHGCPCSCILDLGFSDALEALNRAAMDRQHLHAHAQVGAWASCQLASFLARQEGSRGLSLSFAIARSDLFELLFAGPPSTASDHADRLLPRPAAPIGGRRDACR